MPSHEINQYATECCVVHIMCHTLPPTYPCIQVTQSTKFEDLIGSVSPGTLYAKWITSREPEQKAKPSEEEDLEYYL
jgi:hypothetical protein